MWGQKWGQMAWGVAAALPAPAIGIWLALLLGCLLGAVGVVFLRRGRRAALIVASLVLLVPLSALAGVPFVFAPGTIADANQVNANFAAVIPIIGKSSATGGGSSSSLTSVFPAAANFTAPRDLKCVVTVEPFAVANGANRITWQTAVRIGGTVTAGPAAGPGPLTLVQLPLSFGPDTNYVGTYTEVFSVPSGAAVTFGAQFASFDSAFFTVNMNAVYSCSPTP